MTGKILIVVLATIVFGGRMLYLYFQKKKTGGK